MEGGGWRVEGGGWRVGNHPRVADRMQHPEHVGPCLFSNMFNLLRNEFRPRCQLVRTHVHLIEAQIKLGATCMMVGNCSGKSRRRSPGRGGFRLWASGCSIEGLGSSVQEDRFSAEARKLFGRGVGVGVGVWVGVGVGVGVRVRDEKR